MTWMNEPTPIDRMPGLASDADIDKLLASSGTDADKLFADLMIAHHQGGIHMAQYAVEHATRDRGATICLRHGHRTDG